MNTSVLFRDLLELVDGSDKGSVSVFAKTLREHYVGAVDIQVLSPDAEVIMHEPENKLQYSEYLALLGDVKGGIVYHRKALKEVLNVFRGPGNGYQDYTVVEIDTTPFEQEGILVIVIYRSARVKLRVRLICLLVMLNYQQKGIQMMPSPQSGIFRPAGLDASVTGSLADNGLSWEQQVVGPVRRVALTRFSYRFLLC